MKPLADRIRPTNISEVYGQKHILGNNKILSRMMEYGNVMNMIFYGPPGTGKTTVANIAAKVSDKEFYKLNATNASLSDIKNIIRDIDTLKTSKGILLYLDEIQNFNKKQQQSLLEFIENGKITLIASTTENPFFYIYNAILSRCSIFEFKPLTNNDIVEGLNRALSIIKMDNEEKVISADDQALDTIASLSGGYMRKAFSNLDLIVKSYIHLVEIYINEDMIKECITVKSLSFNATGDEHYNILSALQKSIRGSDPDAAIIYLAMLIKTGDIMSICRRLLIIASEDIGLAYPQAITITKSCVDAALQVGFPEARIPIAQATILLATSPKSNSAYMAIDNALRDIENTDVGEIPSYLKDGHYNGAEKLNNIKQYKYPHNFPDSYINQEYLPSGFKGKRYYNFGDNKIEEGAKSYWEKIKLHKK
ncbi:MAG: replication-associated recombination protein A [Clostridium sp.]